MTKFFANIASFYRDLIKSVKDINQIQMTLRQCRQCKCYDKRQNIDNAGICKDCLTAHAIDEMLYQL